MKIDISISLKDEQGELKRALGKLNDMVEEAYERLDVEQGELKVNQLNVHIPPYMYAVPSPGFESIHKMIDDIAEEDERNYHEEIKEGVKRALKRVGVVRPKLNAADLLFQGLYGECDFEGINSPVLDKYFKVVRVPGWVYYKMNKGVKN